MRLYGQQGYDLMAKTNKNSDKPFVSKDLSLRAIIERLSRNTEQNLSAENSTETMERQNINLSYLRDYLQDILRATDRTMKILQFECEEAKFVLQPWHTETLVTAEIGEDSCTCEKVPSSIEKVEEIASDIDKAVLQAKHLRVKLGDNITDVRKRSSELSLRDIYMSKSVSRGRSTVKDESSLKKFSSIATTKSEVKSKTLSKLSPYESTFSKAKPPGKSFATNGLNDKDKRTSRSSHKVAGTTSKYKQNDNLKPVADKKNISTLSSDTMSPAELGKLIKKISVHVTNFESESSLKSNPNCPFHKDDAQRFVEKLRVKDIDAIEGLDIFGVPQELVKVLKVYFNYLKDEMSDESPVDKRGSRAVQKFLTEIDEINDTSSWSLDGMENTSNLTRSFVYLFKASYTKNLEPANIRELKLKYIQLDSIWKNLNIRKFESVKIDTHEEKRELQKFSGFTEIWNSAPFSYFNGISKAQCIRYTNEKQLLSLGVIIQRLQRGHYLRNLIDLLTNNVIPDLKTLDPTTSEYSVAYKMITVIVQVLNPRNIVLVRTDE